MKKNQSKAILGVCLAISVFLAAPLLATGDRVNRQEKTSGTLFVGQAAPEFVAKSTQGKDLQLSNFKGSPVVLEWTNKDCPFVKKYYKRQDMQKLQKWATDKGAVWLTIISSAKGKQGHLSDDQANLVAKEQGFFSSHIIRDELGTIGRQYGAKTTPHIVLIDENGRLMYHGAIDSIRSSDPDDIARSVNYVKAGLTQYWAGTPLETVETKGYGCAVKY